jgi:HAMP domain-containing protein
MRVLWSGIRRSYLRLNIGAKMLLGYLPLVAIILVLSVTYFLRLERIMAINEAILDQDIPTAETADGMIDSLLSQELYANRYLILGSDEMLEAFTLRGVEFKSSLSRLRTIAQPAPAGRADTLTGLHDRYERSFQEGFEAYRTSRGEQVSFKEQMRVLQDELIGQLKKVALLARQSQEQRTRHMRDMERGTFSLMLGLTAMGILVGAGAALVITRNIAASIGTLKTATTQIAEGKFEGLKILQSQDELGELSRAIAEMCQKLKTLEEMKLDSSPLTHLPGGMAIENVLQARIRGGAPLLCLFIGGLGQRPLRALRGNDVLKQTAGIIVDAVQRLGDPRDFVGHIGGDDFVVITLPERFEVIMKDIIAAFDGAVADLYDPGDRQRLHRTESRQGVKARLPFASLSIAVVNSLSVSRSHPQISEIAAALAYAKTIPGAYRRSAGTDGGRPDRGERRPMNSGTAGAAFGCAVLGCAPPLAHRRSPPHCLPTRRPSARRPPGSAPLVRTHRRQNPELSQLRKAGMRIEALSHELALLYTHPANRSPDPEKALALMRTYLSRAPAAGADLEADRLVALLEAIGRLGRLLRESRTREKELSGQVQTLQQREGEMKKREQDLLAEIQVLQARIEKLQKLDLEMEKRRKSVR